MPLLIADPRAIPTTSWHEVPYSPTSQGFRGGGTVNDLTGCRTYRGSSGISTFPSSCGSHIDHAQAHCIHGCYSDDVRRLHHLVRSTTAIAIGIWLSGWPGHPGLEQAHSSLNLSLSFERLASTLSLCAALFLSRSFALAFFSISFWRSCRSSISVSSSAAS